MGYRYWCQALVFLAVGSTASAFAADPRGENPGSSVMVWVTLLLPTVLLSALIYSFLRRNRRTLALSEKSLNDYQKDRHRLEEHHGRLDAQLSELNLKLGRVIELLEVRAGKFTEDQC